MRYRPRPSAARFARWWRDFDEFYMIGGVGSSKTWNGVHTVLAFCAENPGESCTLSEPTYPLITRVAVPTFRKIFDAAGLREGEHYIYHGADHFFDLTIFGGSRIWLMNRSKPESHVGTNERLHFADELTLDRDESTFERIQGRLRGNKRTWFLGAGTPEGHNWVYRRIGKPTRRELRPGVFGYYGTHSKIGVVHARTEENIAFVGRAFIDRIRRSIPRGFLPAVLNGQFVPLVKNRIYDDFDPARNVSAQVEYFPQRDLLWWHDFNVDPQCSILAHFYDDTFWIFDEIVVAEGSTSSRVAKEFLTRYPDHKAHIIIGGDASGDARSTRSDLTDYHLLLDVLTRGEVVNRRLAQYPESRIEKRSNYVNPEFKDSILSAIAAIADGEGKPHVVIHPRCQRLIDSICSTEKIPGTWEIRKNNKEHLSDAFRYMTYKLRRIKRPQTGPGRDQFRNLPLGDFERGKFAA